MTTATATRTEAAETFPCFGSTCAALVMGDGSRRTAAEAVAAVKRRLLEAHRRFTRFEATSELSRLNGDPRARVPVSAELGLFLGAARRAAQQTGGLVDATLARELEDAGYAADLHNTLLLPAALALAPPRRPARPSDRWRHVRLEPGAVTRPPGLAFDGGGLVKGLVADLLAADLHDHPSFAIDCAGDLRLGGTLQREVRIASPFDGSTIHAFALASGGVATSGIGRRAWMDSGNRPAHHLLDPSTGRPAYTGVVQATALAPTALEAEMRAKAAVLSGPFDAPDWLPHGGALVFEDASRAIIPTPEETP
jgi:FAD:protein FMN transferase